MRLETPRTLIRKTLFQDYQGFFNIYNDKETSYYSGVRRMENVEEAKFFLFNLLKDPYVEVYSSFLKSTGELISTISITRIYSKNTYEIGYTVIKKYRRQGLAYEILIAILNKFIQFKRVDQFQAVIRRNNYKSQNLVKKLGFKYSGYQTIKNDLIFIKSLRKTRYI